MLQHYITDQKEAAATPVVSALGAAEALAPGDRRPGNRAFSVLVGLSVFAHAALLMVSLLDASSQHVGGGAIDPDIISVSIASARDLQPAASASSSVDIERPMPTPEALGSEAATEAQSSTSKDVPNLETPLLVLDTASPNAPTVVAEADDPKVTTQPGDPEKTPPSESAPETSQAVNASAAPLSIGGISSGEASASRGDIDTHARAVAVILGKSRPKGVGAKGKVIVAFTLSPANGAVQMARVHKSSSDARLDALAIAAVANAKFPAPPLGMTPAQLSYRVPFRFE